MNEPIPEPRTQETVAELVETLESKLAQIDQRVKSLSPADRTAAQERHRQESEDHKRRSIEKYLAESGAPLRQRQLTELDRSGEWGSTETRLLARLGTGFLIALIGIRGCGKTQMAVALMRAALQNKQSCRFCSAMEFFMAIKSTYRQDAADSESSILQKFASVGLLAIDEIGQRSENDWENRLLYELINRRYNACRDTLLISNQEVAQLETALGASIVSRMRETGGMVECLWQSYRQ